MVKLLVVTTGKPTGNQNPDTLNPKPYTTHIGLVAELPSPSSVCKYIGLPGGPRSPLTPNGIPHLVIPLSFLWNGLGLGLACGMAGWSVSCIELRSLIALPSPLPLSTRAPPHRAPEAPDPAYLGGESAQRRTICSKQLTDAQKPQLHC